MFKLLRITEKKNTENKNKNFFKGCATQISPAISEEFLKRFFAPIFIILIGLSSSLIITSSKDNQNYKLSNFFKFFLGIFILIVSEILLSSNVKTLNELIIYFFIPIVFFLIIYSFLLSNLRYEKGS